MNLRQETIETYNRSAPALAEYFRGHGSRMEDIDMAFALADSPIPPRILEIGCGDGRDAMQILPRSGWYRGIDISESMLEIAKKSLPEADFEIADAATYDYPENLDIVFAFASLLHMDQAEVGHVLRRVHQVLRPGGVCLISLKERPRYEKEMQEDKFGRRLFYFYNVGLITELAGPGFDLANVQHSTKGKTPWFEVILRKL